MRRSLVAVAFLVLLPCGGCQKTLNFKEYTSADGKYSILMPSEGTHHEEKQTVKGITLFMYGVETKGGVYAASYGKLPPGLLFDLSGAIQGMIKPSSGKVLSEKDFTLEGEKGKEFEAETSSPKGYISGRVMVANGRLYQVFVGGTNARLSNPNIRKFLDSFKISK